MTPAHPHELRPGDGLRRDDSADPLEHGVDPGLVARGGLAQVAQAAGDDDEVVVGGLGEVSDVCHGLVGVDEGVRDVAADVVAEGLDHAPVFGLLEVVRLDDGDAQGSWHGTHCEDGW